MAQSDHYDITLAEKAQDDKITRLNEMHNRLEAATAAVLAHAMPAANDTLTNEEALQNARIVITGAIGADRDLNVPAAATSPGKFYQVRDESTGGNITFQVAGGGGAGVVLPKLVDVLLYSDGTDVVLVFRNTIALSTPPIDVGASASLWLVSPVAGRIRRVLTVVQTVLVGGPAVVGIELGGTDVTGSDVTIASAAAAGDPDDSGFIADSGTNSVAAGGAVEITSDGGATSGAAVVVVEIEPEA